MSTKFFKVDARAILTLGRDSIKDHTTAVVELVKNSYDADAKIVEIDLVSEKGNANFVRIADNGDGMSDAEVESNWLRIGYSGKRQATTSALKRRRTGEKGIGRLSADRLGSLLELRTKAKGKSAVGLKIDWTHFDTTGKEISQIGFPTLADPNPKLPSKATCGTEMRISKLRQKWTKSDVKKLRQELGLLLPPYPDLKSTFQISFTNDVDPSLNGNVTPEFVAQGEVEFDGRLSSVGVLTYSLNYRDKKNNKRKADAKKTLAWKELDVEPSSETQKNKKMLGCTTGPLRIRLSFFPKTPDLLEEMGISLSQLRAFLDRNAGIKIYRDNVRVKPYGDPDNPEGDWLGLNDRKARNPAGAARDDFSISANQVVGGIFISRDKNSNLIDSSSREGLIDSDEFRQLHAIVMRCLSLVEHRYHRSFLESTTDNTSIAAKAKLAVTDLFQELSTLKSELVEMQSTTGAGSSAKSRPPMEQIEIVLDRIAGAAKQIEEIATQATVYRGLASVGIASAVFGHETEISTASAQGKLSLAKLKLKPGARQDLIGVLADIEAAEEAVQQIASWGSFALLRVKKDKRQKQKVSITRIVSGVLNELEKPLKKSDIRLTHALTDITAKTFPMDIEAIVINFVTNAYHAVKSKSKDRAINVQLVSHAVKDRNGFQIVVGDSGPGFDKSNKDLIWQPLFSTRLDTKGRATGTGLGLTIVKSAVEELGGTVSAVHTGALGGAEFTAWFPQS
jgi:signal transduction histidine kinase